MMKGALYMESTTQVKYNGQIVVLIGFMGAGKSAIGRGLAHRLGIPFLDLDKALERRAGCAIREIFDREGEKGFRALESRELRRALAKTRGVIALGGGTLGDGSTPVARRNRKMLSRAGCRVIWINPGWAVIWQRLSRLSLRKVRERPLLFDGATGRRRAQAEIRTKWASRRMGYISAADAVVRVGNGERLGVTLSRVFRVLKALSLT
jgi:shikimate kinase